MHDEHPHPHPPQPGPQPEVRAALDAAVMTGLVVSWAGELDLADVLAAMQLRERRLAGLDIPGWDEPDWSDPEAAAGDPAGQPSTGDPVALADGVPGGDVLDGDPLGEEAVEAALSGAGRVVSLPDLAGYARLSPGSALAGWLDSAPAGGLDDA